jgi:hypothetical protein
LAGAGHSASGAHILADPTCRARAGVLAEMIRTLDGPRTAADRMWEFLLK